MPLLLRSSALFFSLLAAGAAAQPAVVTIGGGGGDRAVGVAPDGAGGVFVTGVLDEDADFDGDGEADLTVSSGVAFFLARYDASGALVFARRFGDDSVFSGSVAGVAADGAGGAYVAGFFTDGDFDGDGTPELASQRGDIYVARYDASGALVFVAQAGGASQDVAEAIAPDGEGGVIVGGRYTAAADFDGDGQDDLAAGGRFAPFVARYDASGALVSAFDVSASTDGAVSIRALAPDTAGGVYVAGSFIDAVDFDGDGTPDRTASGGSDAYVARYDAAGDLVFVQAGGGSSFDGVEALAPDGSGGVFAAGAFRREADFDGDGETDLESSQRTDDAFLVQYGASGDLGLTVRIGGTTNDEGLAVLADGAGGAYLAGYYRFSPSVGDGTTDVSLGLPNSGPENAFLAQFDAAGRLVAVLAPEGPDDNSVVGIATDGAGGVVAVGSFFESLDFGEDAPQLISAGNRDVFVATYSAAAIPAEASPEASGVGLSAAPNPLAVSGTVTLALDRVAPHATVALYDALGRRVAVLHDGPLAAGAHTFAVDASRLPAGLYVLRAATPEAAVSRRVVVAR